MVPHGHKVITSGQIPVKSDVSSDVLPAVDGGVGPALAMDGGLRQLFRELEVGFRMQQAKFLFFCLSFTLAYHLLVHVLLHQGNGQSGDDSPLDVQDGG